MQHFIIQKQTFVIKSTLKINLLLMVIQKFSIVAYNNHSRIVFLEKQIANKWDSLIQRELCDITDGLPVIKHIGYKNTTGVVILMSSWSTESEMTEVACHTAYFTRDRYVLCIARGGEKNKFLAMLLISIIW